MIGLALFLGLNAWFTFGRKPVTEHQVRHEMDKLSASR